MHPELLWSLAAERRRALEAGSAHGHTSRPRPVRHPHPARRLSSMPSLRVSWAHTTLAGVSSGQRGGSVMIVISATRPS